MFHTRTISQKIWLLFLGCLLYLAFTIRAQAENPCDPDLVQKSKDPLQYTLRGDRCEGIYYQNTPPILGLVSLTESFEEFTVKSGRELVLEWSLPKAQEVQVRAQSVQPGLFYRMDTIRSAGESRYSWRVDVLQSLSLSRWDIGVIGWARYSFGGASRDVYLPLRIAQNQQPAASSTYQVLLWPARELNEVFVSIATISANGSPEQFLRDGKPLGYGYYPAERAIAFDIPKPQQPGIYYLEIGATLSNGGVISIEHWFYHAG